jgi:exopolyphosphatase/guanosine-5'-triphosphate,3'-diphosphate pyrophosphatase
VCQLLSLRLAVILCHARRDPEHSAVQLKKSKTIDRCFELTIDPLWAQRFPQSNHLLQQEALAWQKTSWKLRIQMA